MSFLHNLTTADHDSDSNHVHAKHGTANNFDSDAHSNAKPVAKPDNLTLIESVVWSNDPSIGDPDRKSDGRSDVRSNGNP